MSTISFFLRQNTPLLATSQNTKSYSEKFNCGNLNSRKVVRIGLATAAVAFFISSITVMVSSNSKDSISEVCKEAANCQNARDFSKECCVLVERCNTNTNSRVDDLASGLFFASVVFFTAFCITFKKSSTEAPDSGSEV
ncbi:MAG: hypothetical protein JHC93_08470 [Parachlamydiales bacterium]|nr:hypothetical protein [Parachlamydiales bacterium]